MKHLIIAAMPRTGSTMLAEMLALHPAIFGFTEIFHWENDSRMRCHKRATGEDKWFLPSWEEPAVSAYLNLLEAMGALRNKTVLSYKLMESQCPAALFQESRNTFLVRVLRKNMVAAVASWKLALATKRWHISNEGQRAEVPELRVRVEPGEVFDYEDRQKAQTKLIRDTGMPELRVFYHEIARDPVGCAGALFDLIEVERMEVKVTQAKMNVRPLSALVENLDELREKLCPYLQWMAQDNAEVRP